MLPQLIRLFSLRPRKASPHSIRIADAHSMEDAMTAGGKMLSADGEDGKRALRLCAPVAIGGDVNRSESVVLDAKLHPD